VGSVAAVSAAVRAVVRLAAGARAAVARAAVVRRHNEAKPICGWGSILR
jgi:hypothetical protein